MQDVFNLIALAGAIAASLTLGVVSAHVLCRSAFAVLRMHAASVANSRLQKASATS